MYGLYSKKQKCLMAFSTSANHGEFCNEVEYSLNSFFDGIDNLWITHRREIAEKICEDGPTKWYNASYTHPIWADDYYGQLVVVNFNETPLENFLKIKKKKKT